MTHEQILTKAIAKAIAGGWEAPSREFKVSISEGRTLIIFRLSDHEFPIYPLENIIFNKDIARALWGKERPYIDRETIYDGPAWEYHLQMMVISDDPIKYLSKHI